MAANAIFLARHTMAAEPPTFKEYLEKSAVSRETKEEKGGER
jgi:hypothetical protein